MTKNISRIFFFFVIVTCLYNVTPGQDITGKIEFFVNDKPTKNKVRILVEVHSVGTEATVSDDGTFIMPSSKAEWVDVRLISGKHDLLYSHIYLKKLTGDLTFRVFTSEKWFGRLKERKDLGCKPGQKWLSSYDLDHHDGTEVTVTNCAGQPLVMPSANPTPSMPVF